ncbi:hypothetical protein HanIR_Chr04g0178481 [Helianthus annuus]|nr:hypothetical protein HanIR_Chr04g0178481 [Helianthus annuus]
MSGLTSGLINESPINLTISGHLGLHVIVIEKSGYPYVLHKPGSFVSYSKIHQ